MSGLCFAHYNPERPKAYTIEVPSNSSSSRISTTTTSSSTRRRSFQERRAPSPDNGFQVTQFVHYTGEPKSSSGRGRTGSRGRRGSSVAAAASQRKTTGMKRVSEAPVPQNGGRRRRRSLVVESSPPSSATLSTPSSTHSLPHHSHPYLTQQSQRQQQQQQTQFDLNNNHNDFASASSSSLLTSDNDDSYYFNLFTGDMAAVYDPSRLRYGLGIHEVESEPLSAGSGQSGSPFTPSHGHGQGNGYGIQGGPGFWNIEASWDTLKHTRRGGGTVGQGGGSSSEMTMTQASATRSTTTHWKQGTSGDRQISPSPFIRPYPQNDLQQPPRSPSSRSGGLRTRSLSRKCSQRSAASCSSTFSSASSLSSSHYINCSSPPRSRSISPVFADPSEPYAYDHSPPGRVAVKPRRRSFMELGSHSAVNSDAGFGSATSHFTTDPDGDEEMRMMHDVDSYGNPTFMTGSGYMEY